MAKKKLEKGAEPKQDGISIRLTYEVNSGFFVAYAFHGKEALCKANVSNDVIGAAINAWNGGIQTIESSDGKLYSISVQEIKQDKPEGKIIKP